MDNNNPPLVTTTDAPARDENGVATAISADAALRERIKIEIQKFYDNISNYNLGLNRLRYFDEWSVREISTFLDEFEKFTEMPIQPGTASATVKITTEQKKLLARNILSAINSREADLRAREIDEERERLERSEPAVEAAPATTTTLIPERGPTSINAFLQNEDNNRRERVALSKQMFDLYIMAINPNVLADTTEVSTLGDDPETKKLIEQFVSQGFVNYNLKTATFNGSTEKQNHYKRKAREYVEKYLSYQDSRLTSGVFKILDAMQEDLDEQSYSNIVRSIEGRISAKQTNDATKQIDNGIKPHSISESPLGDDDILAFDMNRQDVNQLFSKFKNDYRRQNKSNKFVLWASIATASLAGISGLLFTYFKYPNSLSLISLIVFSVVALGTLISSLIMAVRGGTDLRRRDKTAFNFKFKISVALSLATFSTIGIALLINQIIENHNAISTKLIDSSSQFFDNLDEILGNSKAFTIIVGVLALIVVAMLLVAGVYTIKLKFHNYDIQNDVNSHLGLERDNIKANATKVEIHARHSLNTQFSVERGFLQTIYQTDEKNINSAIKYLDRAEKLMKKSLRLAIDAQKSKDAAKSDTKYRKAIEQYKKAKHEYKSYLDTKTVLETNNARALAAAAQPRGGAAGGATTGAVLPFMSFASAFTSEALPTPNIEQPPERRLSDTGNPGSNPTIPRRGSVA